jgi:hypothetical protein
VMSGGSVRDHFTEEVKRVLASRVASRCSNPACRAATSGPQVNEAKALNVGVAAHISAASPGGPRFDITLLSESRSSAENGIWLCQTCAKLVDNDPTRYSADVLRRWKQAAEESALAAIGKTSAPPSATDSDRKVQAILAWRGKPVTLSQMNSGKASMLLGAVRGYAVVTIEDCNNFYVTIRSGDSLRSISLTNIDVSFDNSAGRLELQEHHA